ncbi:echinoderm microtubule-associated protein-like 1 [Pseudorasbora parva]|uniref:echinoderm microtubule-associated protein-like 1 n=1 Tax=Pseudorasbora parva TaxID=51549 RepID=UPI00351DF00F
MEAMEVLMERSEETQADGFHSECLLPPDTDFMNDERGSPQVSERLSLLEQRVQMQDDEIQLLKMAMADVLKRLDLSEEQKVKGQTAVKARPATLALVPKAASLRKSSSSTLASSPSSRTCSPRMPTASTKDLTSIKAAARNTGTRKPLETKPKEAAATGSRRVTHCKVTMQIYLRPGSGRTGSAETTANPAAEQSKATPLTALVQKRSCRKYKSPVKPPSQYFQICY